MSDLRLFVPDCHDSTVSLLFAFNVLEAPTARTLSPLLNFLLQISSCAGYGEPCDLPRLSFPSYLFHVGCSRQIMLVNHCTRAIVNSFSKNATDVVAVKSCVYANKVCRYSWIWMQLPYQNCFENIISRDGLPVSSDIPSSIDHKNEHINDFVHGGQKTRYEPICRAENILRWTIGSFSFPAAWLSLRTLKCAWQH